MINQQPFSKRVRTHILVLAFGLDVRMLGHKIAWFDYEGNSILIRRWEFSEIALMNRIQGRVVWQDAIEIVSVGNAQLSISRELSKPAARRLWCDLVKLGYRPDGIVSNEISALERR